MSLKCSLLIELASVAVAGAALIMVCPPLAATFIFESAGSYW